MLGRRRCPRPPSTVRERRTPPSRSDPRRPPGLGRRRDRARGGVLVRRCFLGGLVEQFRDRRDVRDRELNVHRALQITGDADQPLLHRGHLLHERVAARGQPGDRPVGLLASGPHGMLGTRSGLLGASLGVGPDPVRVGAGLAGHPFRVAVGLARDRLGHAVGLADHARDTFPELLVGILARLCGRSVRGLGLGLCVAEQNAHELDLIGQLPEVRPDLIWVVPAPDRHELPSPDLLGGDQDGKVEVRRGHGEASSNRSLGFRRLHP